MKKQKRRFWYDTEFIEYPATIDLVSIGIVSEEGEELYLVSSEFDADKASAWVVEHVLSQLPPAAKRVSRVEMRERVLSFLRPSREDKVELWGYYSAYDHVALCWLFGPMVSLPAGMPMYTRDLKQWCDQLGNPALPKQGKGAHNALADARWNRAAWEFLSEHGL